MHRARVQMLRDMISGVPEERVDLTWFFTTNGQPCKTIACIGGWAAIYPPFVEQGLCARNGRPAYRYLAGMHALAYFFDVPIRTFYRREFGVESGGDKQIALRRLDSLLASHE